MAEAFVFQGEIRTRTGTGGSRAVRREGWVPATIYGEGKAPENVKLRLKEVVKAYHSHKLISVLSKVSLGGREESVIGRDIQLNPLNESPIHVDLMRVSANTRVVVEIPVHFLNQDDCEGLRAGGVLNIVRHEVEIEAPATAIPEALNIDISKLEIGDIIHASSAKLPDGVEYTITDRDFTIATIAAPTVNRSKDDEAEGEATEEASEETEGEAKE